MASFKTVKRPDFTRLPELPLPIYVRSTGYFKMEPGENEPGGGDKSPFVQIFWGCKGKGTLRLDGKKFVLKPGDVALMFPGESHGYICGDESWELRWFTFDGPNADSFMRSYAYPRLNKAAGPCPHRLFEELENSLREMTPFRQRRLVSIATEILALIGGPDDDGSRHGRLVRRFVELAQTNYSNSTVNVNALADILEVHRSTLSRVFSERMLISPGEYLERLRMQHALALLKDSDKNISEIAELSGISDASYFSRSVRRATGLSPRQYRDAAP